MNRGLIEAGNFQLGTSEFEKLPRFMNRGLIEALMLASSFSLLYYFPDS